MRVITVQFIVSADAIVDFMPLMRAQAKTSLTVESGCSTFDVCTNPEDPSQVFLYEVYEDDAAFDLHLASDHFKQFDAAVQPMILDKQVQKLDLVAA